MIDLKKATQDLHTQVEECYFPKQLFINKITKDEYITYLQIFYSLHSVIENQLNSFQSDWEQYNLDYRSYFRLELLKKDLQNLQIKPDENFSTPTITIDSFAKGIGYLYVLTGSTMGGKLLASKVIQTPQLKNKTPINNYFLAFGDDTMEKWGNFMQFLHQYMAKNPQSAQIITQGARECFISIIKGLENAQ